MSESNNPTYEDVFVKLNNLRHDEIVEARTGQGVNLMVEPGFVPTVLKTVLDEISQRGTEPTIERFIAGEPGKYIVRFRLFERKTERVFSGLFRLHIVA